MKHRSNEGARSSPPPAANPHLVADYGGQGNHFLSPADDSRWRQLELDGKKQLEGKGVVEGERLMEEESSEEQIDGMLEEEELEEQRLAEAAVQGADGELPKLAEGFYEVEAIRKKRVFKGEAQYLIKWRGWPESANTWEPLDHLQLCPDVVEAFELSLHSGKKMSRKRKRKYTQTKKKTQSSYSQSGSKGSNAVMKKRRGINKADDDDNDQGNDPSQGLEEDSERNDESNSSGELGSRRRFTIQLPESIKPGNDVVNSGSKNDSSEPSSQGDRPTGAKKRKSGSVRRFKPETVSCNLSNHKTPMLAGTASLNRSGQLMDGNVEAYHKSRSGFLRERSDITRILKPVGYSTSISNNVQDVLVTFMALRGDGQEVTVDNKFLKANNPLLLIDFYEQHLRYSTSSPSPL